MPPFVLPPFPGEEEEDLGLEPPPPPPLIGPPRPPLAGVVAGQSSTAPEPEPLIPRAFQRLPPPKKFVLPPFPGEEPVAAAPMAPQELTVSQLPGVIPQEDVMPPELDTMAETAAKGLLRGVRAVPRAAVNTALAFGAGNIPAELTGGLGPYAGMALEKTAKFLEDPRSIQPEGEYSTAQQYLASVAQGIPQLAGVAVLGGGGGAAGAAKALTFAFTQEAGAAYEQAIAAGASPMEAAQAAAATGVANAALEYLPVGALYKRLGGKEATSVLSHFLAQTFLEGGTEGVQEVVGELSALANYAGDKNLDWKDVAELATDPKRLKQFAMAAATGATLGAGTATVTAPAAARHAQHVEALAAYQKQVDAAFKALQTAARADIAAARQTATVGAQSEADAETMVDQLAAVRDVTAEEQMREQVRAGIEQQETEFAEKQRARPALEKAAQFPYAPVAVQPTTGIAPEALEAADERIAQERAAAAKKEQTAADFPFMPQAMRERVAPEVAPPEQEPVLRPAPPQRTQEELIAEADRRVAEGEPVGPQQPSAPVAEAQTRLDWLDRMKQTFNLTDEEVADVEVARRVKRLNYADVVPGGELATKMVDELFLRKRYPMSVPPGWSLRRWREKNGRLAGYVGAKHIKGPKKLEDIRRQIAIMAKTGMVNHQWYERSSEAVLDYVHGNIDDAEVFAKFLAVTSAQTDVKSNWKHATQAFEAWKAGEPLDYGRYPRAMGERLRAIVEKRPNWVDRPAQLPNTKEWQGGRKIRNFYNNLMVGIDPSRAQGVTVDVWMGRAYGFVKKPRPGKEAKAWSPTDAQYDFIESEVTKLAQEMGITPHQAQAAIWIAVKSDWEGTTPDAAGYDFKTSLTDHLANVSWETESGKSADHFPELRTAPWGDRMEYRQAVLQALFDEEGNDRVAKALGMPASPVSFPALGVWGQRVTPGVQAELKVGIGQGGLTAKSKDDVELYAGILGTLFKQDAVGYNVPVWSEFPEQQNAADFALTRKGKEGPRGFTREQMAKIGAAIGDDTAIVARRDGARFLNIGNRHNPAWYARVKDVVARVVDADPDVAVSTDRPFHNSGNLLMNDWGANPNGEAHLADLLARRPDLQGRADDVLRQLVPHFDAVDQDFAASKGWTPNAGINAKYVPGRGAGYGLPGAAPAVAAAPVAKGAAAAAPAEEVDLEQGPPYPKDWDVAERAAEEFGGAAVGQAVTGREPRLPPVTPVTPEQREAAREQRAPPTYRREEVPPAFTPRKKGKKKAAAEEGEGELGAEVAAAAAPRDAGDVFDRALERGLMGRETTDTLFQVREFPGDRSRNARLARAREILQRAIELDITPRYLGGAGWQAGVRNKDAVAKLRQQFKEMVSTNEALQLIGEETQAGRVPGLQRDLEQYQARLAEIEARPGWRFDPEFRTRHENFSKRIDEVKQQLAQTTHYPNDLDLYQGARGVAQFPEGGGPAVIRGLQNPDVSTAIHELAHVARRQLDETSLKRLERIYGVKDGKWDRAAEERFAEDAERYFREIKQPPKLARPLFDRVRDGMAKLYRRVMEGDEAVADINPEVKKFFDERILKAAGKPVPKEATTAKPPRAGVPIGITAEPLPEQITNLTEPGVVGRFFKKYFASKSLTPESAYALHETARSEMRGHIVDASQAANDWYRAEKKGGEGKKDRAALGRYLHGDQAALADISTEEGRKSAQQMRAAVNQMQSSLLESGMLEPGSSMRVKVEESIGTYLTRQYKAFREPANWNYESVAKKHKPVLNAAADYIKGQLTAENGAEPTDQQVQDRLRDFFPDTPNERENPFALLDKVGKKDLSVFMQKKDIPEVLRKLLGEYDDPVVNFLQTYQHIAQVVVNHKMLTELRDVGTREGWLLPEEERTGDKRIPIVPSTEPYSPLAGMVASQDVVDAWQRLTRPKQITDGLARFTLRLMGAARAAKTVLNIPATHVGNILGNYPLMLANGNWGAFGANNKVAWQVAWNSAFDDISKSDQRIRDLTSKLTRLGVVQQSIGANDMRELIRETGSMGDVMNEPGRATANKVVSAFNRIFKVYGAEDDGPKALSYLMEYAKYKQAFPNMPEEQLEQRVADIVKDTMPTYSRINPALRTITRRLPFGNFVSFPMEIARTRLATHNLARKEMKSGKEMRAQGIETGNHELEGEGRRLARMGGRRMVSNLAVTGVMFDGLAELSKMLWGIGDDEEEKLRRGFAPWERYTPKWYLGRPKNGAVSFIDLGGLNPFSSLSRPIRAMITNADDPIQAMRSFAAELIRPYADTDFLVRYVIENALGRQFDDFGAPEFIEGKVPRVGKTLRVKDDPQNFARWANRLAEEVSLYKFASRMQRAMDERVSESGQAAGPWMELLGQTTRMRVSTRDWQETMKFRRKWYDQDLDEAKYFFTGPAKRRGTLDEKKVRTGFHSYVQQSIERQREIIKDIDAARTAGTGDEEILAALTDDTAPYAMPKGLAERLMSATIQVAIPETPLEEELVDELTSTAGDIVSSYQKKWKDEGLTIELE